MICTTSKGGLAVMNFLGMGENIWKIIKKNYKKKKKLILFQS